MISERIACLSVPDLPLAALLRAAPELLGKALAVVDGHKERACVVACSPEAIRAGVRCDMTAVQARSLVTDIILRPVSPALVRSAQAALVDATRALSPRVVLESSGEIYVGLEGLERWFPDEYRLGAALQNAAHQVGLCVLVGVASNLLVARLAAITAKLPDSGVQIVAAGGEREFLAPLPVCSLEAVAPFSDRLFRFGIERLGQLAALPPRGLGRRLGPDGLRLWRQARGEDSRPLALGVSPERFVEESEPGWAIARIEPLLHELRGALERLAHRLTWRGLSVRGLDLGLELESGRWDEREIQLASSSRQVETWLAVIQLVLEETPPLEPVCALRVEAQVACVQPGQLNFFTPTGPAPEKLSDALARLTVLVGEGRVGSPRLRDSHHPDDFIIHSFGHSLGDQSHAQTRLVSDRQLGEVFLPLRVLRPPELVRVHRRRERLVYVHGRRTRGQVQQMSGPWRLESAWWQEQELQRDYYDVELSPGGLYRLFLEVQTGRWFVDGVLG